MKSLFAAVALIAVLLAVIYLPPLALEPEQSQCRADSTNVRRWIDRYGNVTREGRRWPDERILDVYRDNPERAQLLINSPTPHYTPTELQMMVERELLQNVRLHSAATSTTLSR